MGLDEVEADIRKKIDARASAITQEAEKEANALLNKGKEQLFELKKAREIEVLKLLNEFKTREIAQATLTSRKLKLDAKKEAVAAVYGRIEEKLLGISEADKKELLSSLIDRAKRELAGAEYVFCNKDDKKVVSGLCSDTGLKFSGVIECKGGIIVENESGEIRVDYTYENLLADFRKTSIGDVVKQLFGGIK